MSTRWSLEVQLKRAIESTDDRLAIEIAEKLAPIVEVECERMDSDPKAAIPQWGFFA
jgi:hypothetical protein